MCGKRRHLDASNLCCGCRVFVDRERTRFDEPVLAAPPARTRERINTFVPFNQPGI
jgi:hypothetical protein